MKKRRENNRCKIISRFECKGKEMITIRINNTAHVMTYDEWRKIYGMNHQNRYRNQFGKSA